jgi:hypothetical protein
MFHPSKCIYYDAIYIISISAPKQNPRIFREPNKN